MVESVAAMQRQQALAMAWEHLEILQSLALGSWGRRWEKSRWFHRPGKGR